MPALGHTASGRGRPGKYDVVCTDDGTSGGRERKDILTRAAAWMDLEDVVSSDISQSREDRGWTIFPLTRGAPSSENHGDGAWWLPAGWGVSV